MIPIWKVIYRKEAVTPKVSFQSISSSLVTKPTKSLQPFHSLEAIESQIRLTLQELCFSLMFQEVLIYPAQYKHWTFPADSLQKPIILKVFKKTWQKIQFMRVKATLCIHHLSNFQVCLVWAEKESDLSLQLRSGFCHSSVLLTGVKLCKSNEGLTTAQSH